MGAQPPKPPPPAVPAAGGPPVPVASRPGPPPLTFEQRLRRAVGTISEARTTPTQARAVIDGYPRFIGMGVSWTEFPRTLKRHPRSPERSQIGGWWDTMFFHIGNAIMSYQEVSLIAREKPPENADMRTKRVYDDRFNGARTKLEERTAHLELIARTEPSELRVGGSDVEGFAIELRGPVAEVPPEGKVARRIEGAPTPDVDQDGEPVAEAAVVELP